MSLRPCLLVVGLVAAGLTGCGSTESEKDRLTRIEVLAHDGTDEERAVLEQQVAAFNEGHDTVEVALTLVAEGDYNDSLQARIARGDAPDLVEVDGPLLASYVYQEVVVPLDGLLTDAVLGDQLPSLQAQGSIAGHRYAVGTFDSGLGLYADRRALRNADVEWSTSPETAWTDEEFTAALGKLASQDSDGLVLDVKENYGTGEWLTYGFAPLVASAGGDLIDPVTLSPRGHLDGSATKAALDTVSAWAPYIDPNEDDAAFTSRRVALSWVGHWTYRDYAAALGEDLLVLPLPDLGHGSKTGQGSWTWTVTSGDDDHQRAAATFLDFLLSDAEVLRMTEANGAVPGMSSALARSSLYAEDGPLELFADQLRRSCGRDTPDKDCLAVPRPLTPGYAVLSSQFAEAMSVALHGGRTDRALDRAADFVDHDLELNGGFSH
ncbi:ABC transporter substrate-binding protein [Nocardioides humilatus]|uniref:ABC transporter substrate-binding protein n=1 Tax=Nocardioides humilatus TaxID=2607660 RepID=UPI00165FA690|nr:extracellular solute-binding protein [Nocardioides humilatus]